MALDQVQSGILFSGSYTGSGLSRYYGKEATGDSLTSTVLSGLNRGDKQLSSSQDGAFDHIEDFISTYVEDEDTASKLLGDVAAVRVLTAFGNRNTNNSDTVYSLFSVNSSYENLFPKGTIVNGLF